jgi:uncharacterized repeat protein (TIGR03803 family)
MKLTYCSCKSILVLIFISLVIAIPAPAQTLKTLDDLTTTTGDEAQGMIQYTDGNLYGTTTSGGTPSSQTCPNPVGCGTVFKMTPQGTMTTLYSFSGPDGAAPYAGLVLANDGNFYGTTSSGGANSNSGQCPEGCGTVFKITPAGSLTTLYSFCAQTNCADGANSQAPLVQGADGNLYGTTVGGGSQASATSSFCGYCGTVFKISLSSQFTTLYSFCLEADCPDGAEPYAGLVQGKDGNFYGMTTEGGGGAYCTFVSGESAACGTIFKISPTTSEFAAFHSFCSQAACADGAEIGDSKWAGLAIDGDGNFFGATGAGGDDNGGTVFEITSAGQFNTLYNFCPGNDCAVGAEPDATLVLGSDGNFYGPAAAGGNNNCGILFRFTPSGTPPVTGLYSFSNTGDGCVPMAPLVQATSGIFYGSTDMVAFDSPNGTIFSFSITQLQPTTTTLTSSLNPSTYGQAVTFTATVAPKSASGTPTGTVNFLDGSTNVGNSPLNSSGVATFMTSMLLGGTHSMTAAYGGDTTFEPSTSSALSQVVQGATVSLSPTSLNFGSETLGVTSAPQTVTLANVGNQTLTVSSIGIVGTNSSEFEQSNNCPGSVPANGSCTISVTFTPSQLGSANAALAMTDNAPGSPQGVALTGIIGSSAGVSFSPTSLTFPAQYVGTSGLPQTLTVTNIGNATLTISSAVSSSSDFGTLSNCTNPVQPGSNCTIGIFFDPTASGARTGTLTVMDNATGSPQTVPLSGMGEDFSMASSGSSTATVSPGQTANYTVTISPGGGFNQTVGLACSGVPPQSSCTLSPSSVTLNGSKPTSVTVTVTTAGASASLLRPVGFGSSANHLALWLGLLGLPGLVLLGGSTRASRQKHARMLRRIALLCFVLLAMTWPACGGGNSNSKGGGGTPAGSYTLTITGSFAAGSTTLTRKTQLMLTVQ